MKILIIDDDQALGRSLQIQLGMQQHETRCALAAERGLSEARAFAPDLIFLDVNLPDYSGLKALSALLAGPGSPTVVVITGESDNTAVVEAMHGGAFDFLRKPLDLDEVRQVIKRVTHLRAAAPAAADQEEALTESPAPEMIGNHPAIIALHKQIGLLARSRVTVLIEGESGTGKELAARILHQAAAPEQPFVAVNCSAVVATLLESEFFGHEKGAFTGADQTKIGKLEYAAGGSIFLDEIGDMPLDLQAKLLRVLQEEEFTRVGGLETLPLKARIIAATHCDLPRLVQEGRFREDLWYRLSVSTIRLPPLRDRRSDIPLLTEVLLTRITQRLQCRRPRLSGSALRKLQAHNWPGNIRELENVLTRAVALSVDPVLVADDLQLEPPAAGRPESKEELLSLAAAEKRHVERTLAAVDWNISQAARRLAVSPTTLRKKIRDYQLQNPFTPPSS
ncbi:sigma-54-dependent transcriptional regulator [Desulfurivibrio alkaliphilus]|uniref:Two component, sigma54 specific, transcriptional regulator, Fis family n=1 Tax=Desulfurivibrio alkaliphilus (strain DSM 19089 / UNIQEM U267 / AHT2) TaxID=589865 RepID=D6Z1P1_DESAT|nr:sigma-54 dependent transcriptional regulator [Desulfurivibrio alkaliphilus]ADH85466.1 two component, sigma54 specific, transcriptional regulator, Fis family [Desulfurivibrio alkaliphilus AHT 2]